MNRALAPRYAAHEAFLGPADADLNGRPNVSLLSYAAAALLSELKVLAAPATLSCPPLDLDTEDHATLAPLTVVTTRKVIGLLETILAIEALLAVDVLADRSPLPRLGVGTSAAYEVVRAARRDVGPVASAARIAEAVRDVLVRHVVVAGKSPNIRPACG